MARSRFFGRILVILSLMLTLSLGAGADVKLPALISDNMVLQRGAETPIWGTADPAERVTVTMGDQRAVAVADENGKWMLRLKQWDAGGPYEITIAGKNSITLKNVMVGEVWICSGQSNMQWPLSHALNAEQEIADSDYPDIRLFSVKRTVADEPQTDVVGKWQECSPKTSGSFSAVGYFFGRELYREMGVPIGLIHSSWGGTPAESWTSHPTLESDPALKPILDRWAKRMEEYPQAKKEYDEKLAQWQKDAQKAKEAGKAAPKKPWPPVGPNHPYKPSGLYNAMIAPLIPYAIEGAIWYQGESNAGRAYEYRKLFPAMIYDWRKAWGQGDFPFLFVQLANFTSIHALPAESAWAELREAQLMALMQPRTGMAVTIDIGETHSIHPKNKQEVGRRLALAAEAIAYGYDVDYSGPIYKSMTIKGSEVWLRFNHLDGGLVAKGGDTLKGFSIAGPDMKFVWAQAVIVGNKVVVWSDKVPHPIAVRYAWDNNPVCNLYNEAGLPASPFRTDPWPGVTAKSE